MSAIYERELKGILGGDEKVIGGLLKSLDAEEVAAYEAATRRPFLVVRAAGSLGADLVALRDDLGFLIEVKSSKDDILHFTDSPRLAEQIAVIRAQCERSGVLPIYAFRYKGVRGDAWRLFTLPGLRLGGRPGLLHQRLPKVEKTERGNDVMRWQNGMRLAQFLGLLCGPPPNGATGTATARVPASA